MAVRTTTYPILSVAYAQAIAPMQDPVMHMTPIPIACVHGCSRAPITQHVKNNAIIKAAARLIVHQAESAVRFSTF
jgi:hypothetical protein